LSCQSLTVLYGRRDQAGLEHSMTPAIQLTISPSQGGEPRIGCLAESRFDLPPGRSWHRSWASPACEPQLHSREGRAAGGGVGSPGGSGLLCRAEWGRAERLPGIQRRKIERRQGLSCIKQSGTRTFEVKNPSAESWLDNKTPLMCHTVGARAREKGVIENE
jgi:hypothetical protein